MKQETEKEIENSILQFLNLNGFFAWKNQSVGIYDPIRKIYRKSNSPYQINGVSDIIAIKNGTVFFIEVKSKKGHQSEHQKSFENTLKKYGGNYHLVRSIEDVRKIFSI